MKIDSIIVNQKVTLEVAANKETLSKIAKNLEKLLHIKNIVTKIRRYEYDLDVIENRKITTLGLKINIEANPPTLLITVPLKKWTANEIRAIQHSLYDHLGTETANNFVHHSSTKVVSINFQLPTSCQLTKVFTIADNKNKAFHGTDFMKLENYNSTKEIKVKNYLSPHNKKLRIWNVEILNHPKQHTIPNYQNRSKIIYERINLSFEDRSYEATLNNEKKYTDPMNINLFLTTPFSWVSFVKLMHSYSDKKVITSNSIARKKRLQDQ